MKKYSLWVIFVKPFTENAPRLLACLPYIV